MFNRRYIFIHSWLDISIVICSFFFGGVNSNIYPKGKKSVKLHVDVSENRGTPKSSNLIGISIINHPFWEFWGTPIFGNTHMLIISHTK